MIKLFLCTVVTILLLLLVCLNLASPGVSGGWLFSAFAVLWASENIRESFYTSKEKDATGYHGDWTLLLTSALYFCTGVCVAIEFYRAHREVHLSVLGAGVLVLLSAVVLRRWSIKSLGDQWAIHVVGPSQLARDPVLVTVGPYRYMRHPIYLSYILDLIGASLIFHAFYALVLALTVNTFSYILRARSEEKNTVERLGDAYLQYRKKTGFMFPRFCKVEE